VDVDRLAPQLRRVLDAAGALDERLLVLLSVRKAEPAQDLHELLGSERGETIAALGRLSHARLVSHHRPEGEAVHWFATREGKARGELLHRTVSARLAAAPAPDVEPAPAAGAEAESPDHQRVRARRRVSIDQGEKTGFSWD
jgi:hypothetical protein